MKILICGKGPSILTQLKDRSLNDFDKVVRVSNWEPIESYDNRCDAWVYYPWHHIGEPESSYDVTKYFWIKEYWIAHEFTVPKAREQLGREPDYVFTDEMKKEFLKESKLHTPRTGILALRMAQLISNDVWATGFDCYQGEQRYYFSNEKTIENDANHITPHDSPLKEKAWFDGEVKKGGIKVL